MPAPLPRRDLFRQERPRGQVRLSLLSRPPSPVGTTCRSLEWGSQRVSMSPQRAALVWVTAAAAIQFHCHKKLVTVNWKFSVPPHPDVVLGILTFSTVWFSSPTASEFFAWGQQAGKRVWSWLTCFLRCWPTIWTLNSYTGNPRFSSIKRYPSRLPDGTCLSTQHSCRPDMHVLTQSTLWLPCARFSPQSSALQLPPQSPSQRIVSNTVVCWILTPRWT